MRPGTYHAPGLPAEMTRVITKSVRALKDPNRREADRKPRPFKRKGRLARKEDE